MNRPENLLRTPLATHHEAAGARMIEFGAWWMPVQYEGILAEHEHTRRQASLFDCSHMGQFRIHGKQAPAALDNLLPRIVSNQKAGTCRYNFLLNEQGGTLDDIIVYRISADTYYLVVNAGTQGEDAAHIRSHLPDSVAFTDESNDTAKLDLQGPRAAAVLENLGCSAHTLPRYFGFCHTEIQGIPVLLSRTGYTGELGFELYFAAAQAGVLWDAILADPSVAPAGLGARDTLRLEMGYPLYGHELDPTRSPVAAGFGALMDMDHDFIGRAALDSAPRQALRGIMLSGRRAARAGQMVACDGQTVGQVSSGSLAPSLGHAVAMAYVEANLKPGDQVEIAAGHSPLPGTICELPFYRDGSVRAVISGE